MSAQSIAVFFTGPASVQAALVFASAGAQVVLLGRDRDQLDIGGRQIITTLDSLVHTGVLDPKDRFALYSRLQKRVFPELSPDVALYIDAAEDAADLTGMADFLSRREAGVILSLRQSSAPPPVSAGAFTQVLLSAPEPFSEAKNIAVKVLHTAEGVGADTVMQEVATLLKSMGKEVA